MAGKRVALALGSGGARGYAHIGVIEELSDRGFDIVGIAGSSMGALVGGLQAAGKLDDFAEWAKSLTQRAILRLLDPKISAAGVLRAEKILDSVRDILGEVTIEDLPIPYTAVSTDLLSGKSVWLQRGPVDAAIRASIAIPGVIVPHLLDGRLLADGGILDPLPMAPIAAVNADLTIAVSLSGSEAGGDEPEDSGPRATTEWLSRMWRSTTALFDSAQPGESSDNLVDAAKADAAKEEPVPRLGSFEVMNRTIDIAQAALARHTLAAYPPDMLIEVPRTACRSLEFHRAAEVINVGRELAAEALKETREGKGRKLIQTPRNSATAPATHRPCSRPARADGARQAGSSGFLPKAASD
jgi:NTE family protein